MNNRQKQGQQTKQKILNTALELFAEKGFQHVTVDEIVQKTSTSKGAFYNHFKSKHEIFLEKFKEIDDFYISYMETQKHETDTTVYHRLITFFQTQMTYIKKELGLDLVQQIYIHEINSERDSFFVNAERPLYKIMTDFFQEGQEKGEFRTDVSPEFMGTCISRAIRGLLYDWSIFGHSLDIETEGITYLTYYLDGLKK
ncbi:AcrR family transcriptional regulator [Bacillus ectoiniformans]|uniref:TetR family transcriptional regulator n=1 Tax=Bacillus ectoiniformans TaxID=1494429 RepID=UPI00195D25AA|nr:AcrR family transcriptional regulator [Bacillus ectoiniformans]